MCVHTVLPWIMVPYMGWMPPYSNAPAFLVGALAFPCSCSHPWRNCVRRIRSVNICMLVLEQAMTPGHTLNSMEAMLLLPFFRGLQ